MAKPFRKILCAILISMAVIFTSACSFFATEESRRIENIYSERGVNSDGVSGTYIVIVYSGDEYPEDRFFIADAEPGVRGNGIEGITHKYNDDGTTTITIEYTDKSRFPYEFTIPNGLYIANILSGEDPVTGDKTLTIVFSDPEVEPIVLTIESGRDGDSIKNIYTDIDEDGNTVVYVVVSRYNAETGEWEDEETTFTIPKGEQGNGIASISLNYKSYSDPYYYYLDIYYDNGDMTTVTIPRANSWYTGSGEPGPAQYNIGDFYFDTTGYAIYQKQTNGTWLKLVDFSEYSQVEHTVYFYLDNITISDFISIQHGYNFASANQKLPTPSKDGYKFLGWYTEYVDPESGEEMNPNSGKFTDLTPVLSNLTLYAYWQKL